jgi:hypothetical protein
VHPQTYRAWPPSSWTMALMCRASVILSSLTNTNRLAQFSAADQADTPADWGQFPPGSQCRGPVCRVPGHAPTLSRDNWG